VKHQAHPTGAPQCWRCLMEPVPLTGTAPAWLSGMLGVEPTACTKCGRVASGLTGRSWWEGWWSVLPAVLPLLAFYGVFPPALGAPLSNVGTDYWVEATAPVNPPATPLSGVWTTAGPGGAETVKGGKSGDGSLVGGQLPAADSSPPATAGEGGLTEERSTLPHGDGDVPEGSLTLLVPTAQPGHDTLCDEETPGPKAKGTRKKQSSRGTGVEVAEGVFTDEQVVGWTDDWLVDFLTEGLMKHKWTESQER